VQRSDSVVQMFVHYTHTHTHKMSGNLKNSFFLFPFLILIQLINMRDVKFVGYKYVQSSFKHVGLYEGIFSLGEIYLKRNSN